MMERRKHRFTDFKGRVYNWIDVGPSLEPIEQGRNICHVCATSEKLPSGTTTTIIMQSISNPQMLVAV